MLRNQNGYWMSPGFAALFAPDDGGGDGAESTESPAGTDQNGDGAGGETGGNGAEEAKAALEAQIEQLKAEMAKQKEAINNATKEAAKYKRELQSKKTQEEIDADAKAEAAEKAAKELEELRKEVARAKSTKSVMAKLSVDEDTAGKIAENLIGCENIDNALLLIQKAWTAKEKALRLEFGKIPGPGAGGSSEEDAEEKAAIEMAKRLGRERAANEKSVRDGLQGYLR